MSNQDKTIADLMHMAKNAKELPGTGGMRILPPPPDCCQICAVKHDPAQPHNKQSLYYAFTFCNEHDGRGPTWGDAMAHCSDEVKAFWKERLMKDHNIPEEQFLLTPKPER